MDTSYRGAVPVSSTYLITYLLDTRLSNIQHVSKCRHLRWHIQNLSNLRKTLRKGILCILLYSLKRVSDHIRWKVSILYFKCYLILWKTQQHSEKKRRLMLANVVTHCGYFLHCKMIKLFILGI